ncbi:flagellar biosynthetic protein FliR [Citrobacter amalonaticus]|uniref:Flagellar biosynthetic protein FliR n=1 Tax=Citrobacter amalonaticus TaxID=35703 RepID=A0A2S4RPU7_CITAM|nr:flagellar biosynthetic protein FliR [Citrobacter amalonaticus]POT54781.1 flagellar biosynthetic protein FliR [Citrobacter amalonaticus]POT68953.1 flagellar biosynthetic protein FliR [Citrobacter amalonaticus]POU59091.1 flagellar biosynthetic protein FliR [Citrobacter amalonaticus]POV02301.1 flagellar biosynthetic protein FliR [Citrobacter amalonaticus]
MLTLPVESLYQQISHVFWPTLRVLAIFTTAPIFNETEVPKKVKVGLAIIIAFLISRNLPDENLVMISYQGLWVTAQQLMIGAAMGLTVQLIFVTVRTAGEIMGLQMGLSFATFFDPSGGGNMPVIARILNLLATLLFLSFNGHLWFLTILSESFTVLPVNSDAAVDTSGFYYLAHVTGLVFRCGLMLGLPIITLLLSINFTLGLLNRLTPQLSIFVVGFPLTLSTGMTALTLEMYTLSPFIESLMADIFNHLSVIIIMLSGG